MCLSRVGNALSVAILEKTIKESNEGIIDRSCQLIITEPIEMTPGEVEVIVLQSVSTVDGATTYDDEAIFIYMPNSTSFEGAIEITSIQCC